MSPTYQKSMLNCTPFQQQFLSVLDCHLDIQRNYSGYASGQYCSTSLLEHPLISWNAEAECVDNHALLASALAPTLQVLMLHNKQVQTCLTMLERPSLAHAFPVLSAAAVAAIVNQPIERSRIRSMYVDPMDSLLSTVTALNVVPVQQTSFTTTCGSLRMRDQPTFPWPLTVMNAGSAADNDGMSLEQALFPYLVPFSKGHWDGILGICDYLRLRCTQLFSPFTLCKNYLLLMYHVRQAHMLSQATPDSVLQRDMDNYASHNPGACEEQVLHNVTKHTIPASVPGSPAYFRKQLPNLLAMVAKWGLPHFFLTLTADEASPMRWTEITDLESLLHSFNNSFSFRDVPVECAAHFMRRCKDFLADHVLNPDGGILGRVKNYVIRYEPVQSARTPVFQHSTNRYLYHRPRHADRNVVPYHPVILLLWKAHMNLQRVTQTAWSFYVLKYAMKAEPAGHLRIDPGAMAELGLHSMSSAQLATASALILSKPICPAEAAMICLEEPAVQASASVLYIAFAPPAFRKRILRCSQVIAAPIDLYASRPACTEGYTFKQYFS
ncbi:hypothetical protein ABBQ38_011208 [Trebouxia sp. C0009 RCD-2024]